MPAVTRQAWTREEVLALIDANPLATPRYELVDGELLVTPAPAHLHQKAVRELVLRLAPYVEEVAIGELMISPSDVQLEPESLLQPDLYVVPTDEGRRLIHANTAEELVLAIEVISPSSGRHDRGRKRAYYQRNVPEYWIVDTAGRFFERWLPGDEQPEILRRQLDWSPAGAEVPFVMDLDAFFRKIFGD